MGTASGGSHADHAVASYHVALGCPGWGLVVARAAAGSGARRGHGRQFTPGRALRCTGRGPVWRPGDRLDQDRSAGRMQVRWATTESMAEAGAAAIAYALEDRDFAAKVDLAGLPAGQRIFYEVSFLDLGDLKTAASRCAGASSPPPREQAQRALRLVGRHGRAGLGHQSRTSAAMRIYETMRAGRARLLHPFGRHDLRRRPGLCRGQDADGKTWLGPDGKPWRNVTIPERRRSPRRCTSSG